MHLHYQVKGKFGHCIFSLKCDTSVSRSSISSPLLTRYSYSHAVCVMKVYYRWVELGNVGAIAGKEVTLRFLAEAVGWWCCALVCYLAENIKLSPLMCLISTTVCLDIVWWWDMLFWPSFVCLLVFL